MIIDQIPGKKCICICDCGNQKILKTGNVTGGTTKSCGCISSIDRKYYDEDMKKKLMESIDIKNNGCWEWNKSKHRQGYGNFPYKRKVRLAHRISWLIFNGPIEEDILICHKCDNPPCCNPDHLFLGNHLINSKDSAVKGRLKKAYGERNGLAKLSDLKVVKIREMAACGISHQKIAKKFSVTKCTIRCAVVRNTWKHVI